MARQFSFYQPVLCNKRSRDNRTSPCNRDRSVYCKRRSWQRQPPEDVARTAPTPQLRRRSQGLANSPPVGPEPRHAQRSKLLPELEIEPNPKLAQVRLMGFAQTPPEREQPRRAQSPTGWQSFGWP